jgi:FkbM family methyltransferase
VAAVWPAPFRLLGRLTLRTWARARVAPGFLYIAIERWGKYLACRPLQGRLFNGCAVTCNLNEHIQRHVYFFGAYEPIESYLFYRLIEPGMSVIDAGANVGQYTLVAAERVGPAGEVHAFEPVPENFEALAAHVRLNGFSDRVRCNSLALWDREIDLQLNLEASDQDENATNYSVGAKGAIVRTVASPAVRLDDYASHNSLKRVDVIKLDIEGAELHALRGARQLLETHRPTLLMEINRERCRGLGYEPEEMWSLLSPLGYKMQTIDADPAKCCTLESLRQTDRANIICYARALPAGFWQGWTLKQVISDFRSLRLASVKGS